MRPVPALQSGDRGRTALPGKGMALSERGIEALVRPLEQRTRRPQARAEDDRTTAKEEDGVLYRQCLGLMPAVPGSCRSVCSVVRYKTDPGRVVA